jgi:catechol 2,3-dioxygenase-like lactoylglutathione lyase family enzyme
MKECRDFYVRRLGLAVTFEASWFTLLAREDGASVIAFMTPDHPSAPPGPERFSGQGVCVELVVEDASQASEALSEAGVDVRYPLTDEPFGQRRFGFHDPAGVWIDVVEQIEPAEGFWEQYPPDA